LDINKEKYVETVIPKINERVKILRGQHKGKLGIIKARNKKKNNV